MPTNIATIRGGSIGFTGRRMHDIPAMKPFLPIALLLIPLASFAQASAPALDGTSVIGHGCREVEAVKASFAPDNTSAIRTPVAPAIPRINGPRVYGARPGHPFFYHLPVTGQRPITFTAEGLPDGLMLDASTGNITGAVAQFGDYSVTFTATNAAGIGSASLHIVIGSGICLTPPLGWNSWNCFHGDIDEKKICGAADAMVATGLIDHGWTYINMDEHWQGGRDAVGNIQSNAKIPDLKYLVDYIHGKGLKIGLYSSPGPFICGNGLGSWQHEDQDAASYAAWGIDYLKYDLCSYESLIGMFRGDKYAELLPPDKGGELRSLSQEHAVMYLIAYDNDPLALPQTDTVVEVVAKSAAFTAEQARARCKVIEPRINALREEAKKADPRKVDAIDTETEQSPYGKMRASLDKVNRDIVYSICQYGRNSVYKWGAKIGGNTWRTTGDIRPNWKSVESHGFGQLGREPWAGPGHWNDPDMLEVGNGDLTPDENYTHMTLWCMLSAPLIIGCEMPKMSPFIVSLFSNDEALAVNQDALGKQGWRAKQDGQTEVWMKPLADGTLAVAFFNRGDAPAEVSTQWSDLKLSGPQLLRDLWRQKDIGVQKTGYTVNVARHGAELFKVSPETAASGH